MTINRKKTRFNVLKLNYDNILTKHLDKQFFVTFHAFSRCKYFASITIEHTTGRFAPVAHISNYILQPLRKENNGVTYSVFISCHVGMCVQVCMLVCRADGGDGQEGAAL